MFGRRDIGCVAAEGREDGEVHVVPIFVCKVRKEEGRVGAVDNKATREAALLMGGEGRLPG